MRLVVVWRVTTACNLGCGFCAYDRRRLFERKSMDPAEVIRVGRLFASYGRKTGRQVLLSWLGGEPLLWSPLREVGQTLAEEQALAQSVTTNGYALESADMREFLLDSFEEVTVSVDALGVVHERLRGWHGGFDRLRNGVTRLICERRKLCPDFRVRVNVVLMRDTFRDFGVLCRELAGWGVDEVTYNLLGGRDRPEYFQENKLMPADVGLFLNQLPSLKAEMTRRGLILKGGDSYHARLMASAEGRPVPVEDCSPGQQFLFINEEGIVSPCHFTTSEYGESVSQWRSLEDIGGVAGRWAAARRRSRATTCDDCPSTQTFGKFEGGAYES
ncbi:MAG: radical SAM protein [Verrucomicrobiae bacterium]|nr:radical SAM protein [Verrucomicrobiae bacterium]